MTKDASIGEDWAMRFANLMGEDRAEASLIEDETVELLTPQEMGEADRLTVATGTESTLLMERAGTAVALVAGRMVPPASRIAVLAGPGNNGGDGFVAARLLLEAGYIASVHLVGSRAELTGDANLMARQWTGPLDVATRDFWHGADLIIDALFGAGLNRPVDDPIAQIMESVNGSGVPVLAVDLPSGVDGRTGAILGRAINAAETVTFFRRKPGHLLLPGRRLAGRVTLADIGIAPECLDAIAPSTFHNMPHLWSFSLPRPALDGHKYGRGHAVVVSGPLTATGAARIAARAALRAGAGLVTLASPADAIVVNAAQLTAIMLVRLYEAEGLAEILADQRKNTVVLGMGLGVGGASTALVGAALGSPASVVVDADGLTSFAENPASLFEAIRGRHAPVVLTPHDGEFARLFPDLAGKPSKLDRAREASVRSGAVVVLKGPDTVVADPDGHAAIADNAPPYLATAGAGDVLAGIIGGLLAQGMMPFDAAAAAVWMHGAAASAFGPGLIAEDLPETLPRVLSTLFDPPDTVALSL